ncbi:TonB-dependent receptor [Alkalicaulis satelles]|uniref:TonB-dependent receptor n=1 Tax=Alkalicaulis satelles TaxID=2609175 RepID=A0A5M6ZF49_9PROT|nr:TonB-dependent receptor [Alkalicaulis satelles]KAA5803366.1 TonB-dependent receptor [Alkalicaulis satelles]
MTLPLMTRLLLGTALIAPALAGAQAQAADADLQQRGDAALDRVIVTAGPLGRRYVDEMIQPVSVLHGSELERRMAGSLGEMLDGLPGVTNADFGPGVGRPVIRGQQGSRVMVLDDGLPVADVSGEGVDHAVAVDSRGASQIEVFRGPTTLMFGSGAAGGVINVRSKRFLPTLAPSPFLEVDASYSPNGDDRQIDLSGEVQLSETFALRASGGLRRANDFSINGFQEDGQTEGFEGRLQNSSIESSQASLTGIMSDDWGFAALSLSYWDTDYGIPEVFDPMRIRGDGSDEYERVTADYVRADFRSEINQPLPGVSLARLSAAWTRYEQDETEFEFSRTDGSFEDSEIEATFENREFEARADLLHDPVAGWEGVIGLQYTNRDFFADDPRGADRGFYVRPNLTRTFAAYVIEERRFGPAVVELGARIERIHSSSDPVIASRVPGVTLADGSFLPQPEQIDDINTTALSLSASTIIDVGPDHHARFGLTRAERAPSPEQRYAFGRHSAAGTWELGDPDLKSETYLNFEASWERHTGPLRYDLTAYYNRADNFIFLTSEDDGTGNPVFVNDIGNRAGEGAAAGCLPGDGGLCRLRNQFVTYEQGDAHFYGVELGGSWEAVEGDVPLTFHFVADYVRGSLRDGGDLPRISPWRYGLGASTRLGDLTLRADYLRINAQNRVATAESATDGYNLVSLDASYDLPFDDVNASVYLKGRNLLDEAGRRHTSFFKDDAPIIGRAFYVGVRARFGGV